MMPDTSPAAPSSTPDKATLPSKQPKARLGLFLAFFGAMLITPDTLLIRLTGLEGWGLSAWRGLLVHLIRGQGNGPSAGRTYMI